MKISKWLDKYNDYDEMTNRDAILMVLGFLCAFAIPLLLYLLLY